MAKTYTISDGMISATFQTTDADDAALAEYLASTENQRPGQNPGDPPVTIDADGPTHFASRCGQIRDGYTSASHQRKLDDIKSGADLLVPGAVDDFAALKAALDSLTSDQRNQIATAMITAAQTALAQIGS